MDGGCRSLRQRTRSFRQRTRSTNLAPNPLPLEHLFSIHSAWQHRMDQAHANEQLYRAFGDYGKGSKCLGVEPSDDRPLSDCSRTTPLH